MTDSSMSSATSWRPLLDGELASAAERSIDRIANGLPKLVARGADGGMQRWSGGLGGYAAEALFWAYLSFCRDEDEQAAERAMAALDHAADDLAQNISGPALHGGFTGTGFVMQHLEGQLFESEEGEDLNEDLDQALLEFLDQKSWESDYDLISGLVGYGVYALERLHQPSAGRCLGAILDHLEKLAVDVPGGVSWFSPASLLPEHQRERYPEGYYNLGVAHGMPAVIALLARSYAAGFERERTLPLLEQAVSWLLAHRLVDAISIFPNCLDEKCVTRDQGSRVAWCYGDPGIAATLILAAHAADRDDWQAAGLECAHKSASCPTDRSGIRDVGLCHGSGGIAHIFNRIYQATGDELCGEAARTWYRHAVEWTPPGDWATGYPGMEPKDFGSGNLELRETAGFLTGASGIGLALLAATSDVAPDWDRLLMVDIPPR